MSVKYYNYFNLCEDPNGAWVKRSDYEALLAKLPPEWVDCTHDEAMEALADGQDVQAWYTSGGYYRNVETRGVNLVWADCDTMDALLYATTTRQWRVKQ